MDTNDQTPPEFQPPTGWLDSPAAPKRYTADGDRLVALRKPTLSRYRNEAAETRSFPQEVADER